MMLDAVKTLLGRHTSESERARGAASTETDPAHVAACALLLEVAYADGAFTGDERAHLQGVLERHFDLPADSGQHLLVLADGKIAREEQYLTRKIANLLDLKPGYLSRAKRTAAERGE